MRFVSMVKGLAPALGMAALLSGCAAYDSTTAMLDRGASSAFEGLANLAGGVAPWGGTRPASPGDSLTVQRVRGERGGSQPLMPEDGNVWPEPEAPRATLMNPDQALRGIAGFSPATPAEPPARRGAGGPQVPAPTSGAPEPPAPQSALPPLAPLPPATSRLPVQTRQGTLTPSTDSTFNSPTGSGTLTRDGNTTIVNRPGEPPQIIQNPR